jgi:hypothetical protein
MLYHLFNWTLNSVIFICLHFIDFFTNFENNSDYLNSFYLLFLVEFTLIFLKLIFLFLILFFNIRLIFFIHSTLSCFIVELHSFIQLSFINNFFYLLLSWIIIRVNKNFILRNKVVKHIWIHIQCCNIKY